MNKLTAIASIGTLALLGACALPWIKHCETLATTNSVSHLRHRMNGGLSESSQPTLQHVGWPALQSPLQWSAQ